MSSFFSTFHDSHLYSCSHSHRTWKHLQSQNKQFTLRNLIYYSFQISPRKYIFKSIFAKQL
jgi:hypothetical protein